MHRNTLETTQNIKEMQYEPLSIVLQHHGNQLKHPSYCKATPPDNHPNHPSNHMLTATQTTLKKHIVTPWQPSKTSK